MYVAIDGEIVALLARREALVRQAAPLKADDAAVRAPARVEQVIARVRQLASLSPLTLRSLIPLSQLDAWYGEREILQMFERNGYRIEFAPEPAAA